MTYPPNKMDGFLNISEIEKKLVYIFKDPSFLSLAFIHRSFFNENRREVQGHNERLEFLGDSVLGLILSDYLYISLPHQSEGHLSHLRSHLASADACVDYLRSLHLEGCLQLGKGEAANLGRGRYRILANLFEALVGAIYLDGGIDAARDFFLHHFKGELDQMISTPLRNWKGELQDYAQKKTEEPPQYVVLEEKGPPHNRHFVVAVEIEEKELGRGVGPSKKIAEQEAAEDALRQIEKGGNDG